MRLDPHHRPVRASHRVDGLVRFPVRLGLNPETAHGVDHRLRNGAKRQGGGKHKRLRDYLPPLVAGDYA